MAFPAQKSIHLVRILTQVGRRQVSSASAAISQSLQYFGGKRVASLNQNAADDFDVFEPATGKVLCQLRNNNADDVNRAVAGAKQAFESEWSTLSGSERGKVLLKTAQIIRENSEEFAKAEVHDTGKPIWEARYDIEGCADAIEFYGGLAPAVAGQHITLPGGSFAYTRREPIGVVGGIGAWNFPFQMAAWKSSPALACGNTMVFKPSQLTPLTAVMLAEAYSDAGLPKNAFNVIQGGGLTGSLLSGHPDISKMTFTGSLPVGSKIMEACAKDIKRVTLELGGKSPLIIFEDCHLENAVKGALLANFLSQGQVCSNGTRVFVQRSIWDEFLDLFVTKVRAMKIGNPFDEDVRVGATISEEHFHKVMRYISVAKEQGVIFLCGGESVKPADPALAGGHYISPAVAVNVTDDMQIAREEIFGPVACVFQFDTEEEVIKRANDTEFGLAGGVFTRDLTRAHRVSHQIQAGNIYVNNYNMYPCQIPFGGFKKSGIGRESGAVTLDYYTEIKTVYVEMQDVDCPLY